MVHIYLRTNADAKREVTRRRIREMLNFLRKFEGSEPNDRREMIDSRVNKNLNQLRILWPSKFKDNDCV